MRNAWPTPDEERANTWRHSSPIVQCVFFVLTIIAISALYGFCHILEVPPGPIVMAISIAVAEMLIWRAHFWRTGVESALWIGGLYAFIFSLPSTGKPEAWLVLAAAAALAGWRVRNALFGTLAATLVVTYFAASHAQWGALFLALAIALIALGGQTLEWRRPSTELLCEILALVMPVAGYVAILYSPANHFVSDVRVIAIFFGLAAIFAIVGMRRRLRVPFIAATVAIAIGIIEAHSFMPVSLEAELIMIGAVTLAIAGAMLRSLRDKKTGFVLGVPKRSDLQDALSVAPALLPVHGSAAGPSQHTGGGGEFGGAGASGNY